MDGEKYTGISMKKSSLQQGRQNSGTFKAQPDITPATPDANGARSDRNGRANVVIRVPDERDAAAYETEAKDAKSPVNEKQQEERDTLDSPGKESPESPRPMFNLKGLRTGIMDRLFHRRNDSGNDGEDDGQGVPMSPSGPNEGGSSSGGGAQLPEGMSDPAQALRNMGSPAGASSITMAEVPDYSEEAREAARKITSTRRTPTHSGGILSNLLRLQALSQASSSSKSRRSSRRHQRRHPNSRRNSLTRSSAAVRPGPEILPPGGSRYLVSTPSASALSLPGLAMGMMHPSLTGHLAGATVGALPGSGQHTRPGWSATAPSSRRGSVDIDAATAAAAILPTAARPTVFSEATSAPTTPTRTHPPRLDPRYFLHSSSARSSISIDDDGAGSVYSSMSHDPLMAAFRLSQHAQLTEAVAEILLKQDLLIRLCKSLIRYGAPSHRIELAMEAMCKTLGVDGSFAFLPGLMMISFGDTDTHTSETHLIKCSQGFDLGRLDKVNKIARALVYGRYTPAQALEQLKTVNAEKPLYNVWKILASFTISSGLVAPLIFRGSWYDMLAAGGLGTVVGLTSILASRYSVYSNVFEVSTSIVIAFLAKALREYVCFTGVVLSAIVMLLPGLSLTTAIMELSSRYMISGSVRMFYSLIYCLFLGFGLSIGAQLWDVFTASSPPPPGQGDAKAGYCHPATEPWRWALFPFLAIAFNVQLHATPRQWPVMVICSAVGLAVSEVLGKYWPSSQYISAAVSAFVSGLLGNIYERLTHELAFVPILGAILLIVPGGMGVRSSLLLLEASSAGQGTSFALQMILVALGIAVGLFASTLVVFPLGKKRNVLLTF
ncbi:hypothetical protein BGZ73_003820 [Actinomortierella ambigua]|nr:hypothetical protein BGZ73_003820 [Actinomortierella ambigua]